MGRFFYKCLEIDAERDLSFIVKTYGFQVLDLDFETGMAILNEGYKMYRDERLWQLYCIVFPNMSNENFMTFEDFKKNITGGPARSTSKVKVLEKVEGILNSIKWKQTEI